MIYSTARSNTVFRLTDTEARVLKAKRGKQDFFVFGCILLNKFNAYRDINQIADVEYDYYSFCAELVDQLYMHSLTLSDAPL